jgi:septal ring factor EnvC (AmiA/AmiB activator)
VVAPYDGRVEFAGAFKGYGQILIIRHSDGYISLISGLSKLAANVGDDVTAGEPVGSLSDNELKPKLYYELRYQNRPVDPSPFLAAATG